MREPGLPEHVRHIYEGEPDEDLIEALEPDQLVDAMESKLPCRLLGRWTRTGLWALRVFVLTMTGLVVYTFVASLGARG
ncbi:MAG TPA: hypothetical protein VNG93_08630 [Candidatus Dormibacteraeota bacterium]|nr:hypothetical protein [Candidatus Dormibacteraeota bacterium]